MKCDSQTEILEKLAEFSTICKSAKFFNCGSTLKKTKTIKTYMLDYPNPLRRGQILESILLQKIASKNHNRTILRLDGKLNSKSIYQIKISHSLKELKKILHPNDVLFEIFLKGLCFDYPNEFKAKDVLFKPGSNFSARRRCIAKASIDYCFIDLIIDDTIIEIKTDIHTKSFKKHVKQVFIHCVMFSDFIKSPKNFDIKINENEIQLIDSDIKKIAVYFWRTNEFYSYKIEELISTRGFKRLVSIYGLLKKSHATELRNIMRQELFQSC